MEVASWSEGSCVRSLLVILCIELHDFLATVSTRRLGYCTHAFRL